MPRTTSASTLAALIAKLRADRQRLAADLDKIDTTFAELGISADGSSSHQGGKSRRPAGAAAPVRRRRSRRHFGVTAEMFVLGLLKGKTLTTAQINAAWKKGKRGGVANNTLGTLVKTKKIKRSAVKGGRGSQYSVV